MNDNRKSCDILSKIQIHRAREKVSEIKLNYANKVFTYPIPIYQTMIFSYLRTRDSQAVIRIVLSFKEMLKQCRQRQIRCIVCYRLDRISRNVGDFFRFNR